MTALLTDNLPLLAGASNGIKKLRQLILELAVRGKLVPQDPNDEPASEILKRITEQKARLVNERKKLKLQAEISEQEKPFSVPKSWGWVRLGSCLEMINGRAFKPTEWRAAGLPIVRIQNLNKPDAPFNYCSPETVDNRHIIDNGTILISWSGTPGTSFGAFIWERGKAALNQHIFSCSQIGDAFFDKFLKLAINTRLEELIAKAHGGVGLQHVTKGKLEALTLVLPPLAEQHRIVAKVDELMALCDRLEAQQVDAESAHAQLVQALLDSLTQVSDATDFAANWQRLAEQFHTLFTTELSIDTLKQTLLQLAVMGKLVLQDPTDEPASELIDRIQVEKQRLVAKGKIKKQKILPEISEQEKPFALPEGWSWARLGEVGISATGKTPSTNNTKFFGGELQFIGPGQISVHGEIAQAEKWLTELARNDTSIAEPGDLLMVCIGGSIGKCAIADREVAFNQQINSIRILIADHKYIFRVLASPNFKTSVWASATGTATPIINRSKWDELLVSIPPEREQQRIVAKVDQLMALCDTLKQQINAATEMQSVLLNTMMTQA